MATLISPGRFATSLSHFTVRATPSSIVIRVTSLCTPLCVTSTRIVTRRGFNSMSESESNSKHDASKADNSDELVVQYVVLRRDLIDTWPLGSVVTQGCHASVSAIWFHKDDPHTLQYCGPGNIDSMHKVTLEVKGEPQILHLSEKLTAGGIDHKLWIEQPENIPTCLATKPYPKSVVALFFKKLKLCN